MKHYKITNKYDLCIRSRSNLPYDKFWFEKSNIIRNNRKSLGYSIGIYLYFWHISIDVNPF